MKRLLILALAVVCCASLAHAQAGKIAIFSDLGGTSCEFVATGFVQIHSFHINTSGATGCQWKLEHPAAWSHFGDLWEFDTIIGNSNDGVSIGYGSCLSSPIYLGVSNYGAAGDPANTCIWTAPDPGSLSGKIEGVNCSAEKTFPASGSGLVNPDGTQDCTAGCGPLPVEDATWGQIKSLYR